MNVSPVTAPCAEPFYVAQTFEPEHLKAPHLWFQAQLAEIDLERVGWHRMTVRGSKPRGLLIEAWETRPTAEGEPRFAFAANPLGDGLWPL
ncbi:hypothetical protein KX928_23185 [Roseobacter sp. YSTF-M11]|uniref:Uncharacterized protein n=1 Tax=Roseobacter insulae TaxID=2859783 RepID=A0A9X1G0J7_9RHOB|nr:hypothetical protein [Roseobacter insulae]MBW4710704.1 hypothetical protein [Roseobacter insulae]